MILAGFPKTGCRGRAHVTTAAGTWARFQRADARRLEKFASHSGDGANQQPSRRADHPLPAGRP
jgi:hypothetical protein